MSRAATSPELTLFRTPGQWSRLRAAVYPPSTVFSCKINQSFSTRDKVLELTYDTPSGTLANVLEGMTAYIGSTPGAWDKGIVRVRSIDSSKVYIGETSDIVFQNNDDLTIVDSFELRARPILISSGVVYMDGGIAYSDQHTNYLPLIRGGSNRVLHKTGATVSTQFTFSATVPGSSVSSRSTSAPGSSSISGGTTATPTITWNSVGWKRVTHTVTAANGKSNFIVRYVFVWDATNEPEPVEIGSLRGDTEAGGWELSLTLYDSANTSEVRDHALIILFSEDHYGASETQIGPVSGCENILFNGWIAGESIDWKSEGGSVSFTAYTAHYFLQKIAAWPDGILFTTGTPADWTKIKNLTVDLGLVHHFLQWRTTAPRIIDIYPTGDTKYTKEVASLASDLWSQMQEMAFDQLFARPLCNRLNQLYIEIHPQLIPEADRTHPTVMTITEQDIEDGISLTPKTMDEASIVDLSGVAINANGKGRAYFSLSPGHSHSHYGNPVVQNRLLLSSQSQANTLAGLYRGWLNPAYEPLSLKLSANNRLVDICPLQKCALSISSGDTIREIADSLGLIPLTVEEVFDPASGYSHSEISFEVETFEDLAVTGDTPGSGEVSFPPLPPLPPLPPFEVLIPGVGTTPEIGGEKVLLHDTTYGLLYTENFDDTSPDWITVNAGLDNTQYPFINAVEITPSGAVYVAFIGYNGPGHLNNIFIAYAPSIGATFEIIEDVTSIRAKHAGSNVSVTGLAVDPLTGRVGYVLVGESSDAKLYVGTGTSFVGSTITGYQNAAPSYPASLSYGFGNWVITGPKNAFVVAGWFRMNSAGTALVSSGNAPVSTHYYHLRVSTTDLIYHFSDTDGSCRSSTGNCASFSSALGDGLINGGVYNRHASDPTGLFWMLSYGGLAGKGRSSDGIATIAGIPSLPAGPHYFAYAGGEGVNSHWVAASGIVRKSEDDGTTWINKEGTINLVAPILGVDVVKVIGV